MKIKKGDKVMVIAGKSKGQSGTVSAAIPAHSMVVVEGLNLSKKHLRKSQKNRTGQIVDRAMPLHVSNVQLIDPKSGKPTRVKIVRGKDGKRERVAVKSGEKFA